MGVSKFLSRAVVALVISITGLVALGSAPAYAQLFEETMFDSDLLKAVRDGDTERLRVELLGGASPNDRSSTGASAILAAVENRNLEAIGILAEAGGRVDTRNRRNDRTALTRAAEMGQAAMVRELLEHGADVDRTGEGSEPALIKAARNGHDDVLAILIEYEADLYATDLTGMTALAIAEQGRYRAAVQVLEEAGAPRY